MFKLGDAELTLVDNEEIIKSNNITDYPTEDSNVIADNIEVNPLRVSISGIITGINAFNTLQLIRKYSDSGELIKYTGRNIIDNCVIENLSTVHDSSVKGGLKFKIDLKQVVIANLQETNINFKTVKPQVVNKVKNLGKKSILEITKEPDYLDLPLKGKFPSLTNLLKLSREKSLIKSNVKISTPEIDNFSGANRRRMKSDRFTSERRRG